MATFVSAATNGYTLLWKRSWGLCGKLHCASSSCSFRCSRNANAVVATEDGGRVWICSCSREMYCYWWSMGSRFASTATSATSRLAEGQICDQRHLEKIWTKTKAKTGPWSCVFWRNSSGSNSIYCKVLTPSWRWSFFRLAVCKCWSQWTFGGSFASAFGRNSISTNARVDWRSANVVLDCPSTTWRQCLGGGFKYFFIFIPKIGEMIQFDQYFENGLNLPTRCWCLHLCFGMFGRLGRQESKICFQCRSRILGVSNRKFSFVSCLATAWFLLPRTIIGESTIFT